MENRIDTIEYKKYTIATYQDDTPESPRDWDNLGTMVCFHNRYILGDEHSMDIEELQELVKSRNIVSLPLYLYDHSGIGMSTGNGRYPYNCPWDSGQVGYIFVSRESIRKEYSVKRITQKTLNKAIGVLQSEAETYHQFISGDVYGYTLINQANEIVDSCWGFYGYDHMVAEAKEVADCY